uniref:Phosphofructokinase domain-containing protein n=1 Tax=Rhodosorus marinus TaxID=101924 RepID=A0A7S3A3W8_9RHOD|mmetsp:Transcript_43852/g.171450  ORF Transcript_43852/g.171450 Transcript_43852/m.171450 type:complete len:277 (+) Transcript_43852:82-912(+)
MAFVTGLAPPRSVGKTAVTRTRRWKNVVVAIERQGGHAAADPEAVAYSDSIEYPSPEGPFCELGHLSEVPHLTDYLPDLEVHKNPAAGREFINRYFVDNGDAVMKQVVMNAAKPRDMTMYMRAGPRESVYFHPDEVRAAIVSCGGICPGINTVIREVVENLWYEYGVRSIFGVQNGYRGFYSKNWKTMNPEMVDQIHKQGGTILGSSRGGFDCRKIMDALETRGINHVSYSSIRRLFVFGARLAENRTPCTRCISSVVMVLSEERTSWRLKRRSGV